MIIVITNSQEIKWRGKKFGPGIGNELLMARPAVHSPDSPEGYRDSSLGAGANLHTQLQQLIRRKCIRLYLFIYAVQHTQCFLKTRSNEKHSPRASMESFISGMTGTASLKPACECPTLSPMSPPATRTVLGRHASTLQDWPKPCFQGGLHKWQASYTGKRWIWTKFRPCLKLLYEIAFNEKWPFFPFRAIPENRFFQKGGKKKCFTVKTRGIALVETHLNTLVGERKNMGKCEYMHFCPVQSDRTPWAISLSPKVAGQGPVWQHPAKLHLGTDSNSSTASRLFFLPRAQLSHLLQFSSIKTKLTTNSFLTILAHILHNTR